MRSHACRSRRGDSTASTRSPRHARTASPATSPRPAPPHALRLRIGVAAPASALQRRCRLGRPRAAPGCAALLGLPQAAHRRQLELAADELKAVDGVDDIRPDGLAAKEGRLSGREGRGRPSQTPPPAPRPAVVEAAEAHVAEESAPKGALTHTLIDEHSSLYRARESLPSPSTTCSR